LKNGRFSY